MATRSRTYSWLKLQQKFTIAEEGCQLHLHRPRVSPTVINQARQQSLLAELPSELLDRIITHFIGTPFTTFYQLKFLRLVCRSFSHVVERRVLSCVRLFGSRGSRGSRDNPVSDIHRLYTMFSSKTNGHLYMTNTLVLGWKWRPFKSSRTMRISNQRVCGKACDSTLAPLVYLLVVLFVPRLLPLSACNLVARLYARYRLSRASVLNTMPNVRRVIWQSHKNSGLDRIASGTVKLLLEFHQLSELVLLMDYDQDLSHIFECFSKLHNLRKLRIEVHRLTGGFNLPNPNPANDLGKVLGANLNLTHFELLLDNRSGVSFSTIFGHVPASSPLKLEHFGIRNINSSDKDLRAIIPHIRSLTSTCCYLFHDSELIRLLHSERIFPPNIQISRVDQPMDLIHYLNDHPGIISLSIRDPCFSNPSRNRILLESLARHSKSLTYFSTDILTFSLCNCNVHWELLSQCTKLRRLVLSSCCSYCVSSQAIKVLPMIAHLSSSVTLVITDSISFESCIWHCRQSRNPLIHDLAGRIVYEAPKILGYDERSSEYWREIN